MERSSFTGWPVGIMDGLAIVRSLDGASSLERWDRRSKSWVPSPRPIEADLSDVFRTSAKLLSPAELADEGIPVPQPELV